MKHNCFSTSTVLDFAMHMKKKKKTAWKLIIENTYLPS